MDVFESAFFCAYVDTLEDLISLRMLVRDIFKHCPPYREELLRLLDEQEERLHRSRSLHCGNS